MLVYASKLLELFIEKKRNWIVGKVIKWLQGREFLSLGRKLLGERSSKKNWRFPRGTKKEKKSLFPYFLIK